MVVAWPALQQNSHGAAQLGILLPLSLLLSLLLLLLVLLRPHLLLPVMVGRSLALLLLISPSRCWPQQPLGLCCCSLLLLNWLRSCREKAQEQS
jgi:hypothetical protein